VQRMSGALSIRPLRRPGNTKDMLEFEDEDLGLQDVCCWRYKESCFSRFRSVLMIRGGRQMEATDDEGCLVTWQKDILALVKPLSPNGVRYMGV